jgi:two-component system, chemotaxis family, response regulator WspF
MRIAIVNDLPMAVESLRRLVSGLAGHSVAWIAQDGAEAVKKCAHDTPDLILMDLVMPVLGGVEATRRIMARNPCAILVVTATVEGHAEQVLEALGAGALDAVQTPTLTQSVQLEKPNALTIKIETIRSLISESTGTKSAGRYPSEHGSDSCRNHSLVVVGSSAGGPSALAAMLRRLPRDFPAAVIVIQHIDAEFAPSMASWLSEQTAMTVRIARERDKPEPGAVLIAGTNDHLVFLDSHYLGYTAKPFDSFYRPSVDVFFESVVRHWKGTTIGVLLTGMGRDGAQGLKALRDSGALTISQDAKSCVVYGMPKAAADLGAAVEILPLDDISSRIVSFLGVEPRKSCA